MVGAPSVDTIGIMEIVLQARFGKQSDGRGEVVLQSNAGTYRPLHVRVETDVLSINQPATFPVGCLQGAAQRQLVNDGGEGSAHAVAAP